LKRFRITQFNFAQQTQIKNTQLRFMERTFDKINFRAGPDFEIAFHYLGP